MTSYNDSIYALAAGTLSSEEEARLRAEIAADPELAEELRLQEEAIAFLSELDSPTLTEFESAKIRSAIHKEIASTSRTPTKSRGSWMFAAAAVILVLVGAVSVLPRLSRGSDSADLTSAVVAESGGASLGEEATPSAGSAQDLSATTTAAASTTTFAPATSAFAEELDGGFALGDVTAAEYLSATGRLIGSTLREPDEVEFGDLPAEVGIKRAAQSCLDDLSEMGFQSYVSTTSTFSGDVIFGEKFDPNGLLVEVVKLIAANCVEIDRAP
ncbi:MAG: hypothetical protein IIC71_06655 [Acidobacteria bacterium]|nr:hypothetical protein [Acidobacteriota bacterium]